MEETVESMRETTGELIMEFLPGIKFLKKMYDQDKKNAIHIEKIAIRLNDLGRLAHRVSKEKLSNDVNKANEDLKSVLLKANALIIEYEGQTEPSRSLGLSNFEKKLIKMMESLSEAQTKLESELHIHHLDTVKQIEMQMAEIKNQAEQEAKQREMQMAETEKNLREMQIA